MLNRPRAASTSGSVYADNTKMTNWYDLTSLLTNTAGSRPYPVAYAYDYAGRLETMTTWQDHAGNARKAVTAWNYSLQRGWLESKRYEDIGTAKVPRGPPRSLSALSACQRETVAMMAIATSSSMSVEMTIGNHTEFLWHDVFAFNCLNPIQAPAFHDWRLERTYMSKQGQPFCMAKTTRVQGPHAHCRLLPA